MAHVLINGMTLSGKTALSKRLCRHYQAENWGVIILDPLHDPGWYRQGTDENLFFQTDDNQEFLYTARNSQRCMIFVDESGESVGQYDKEMHWLATRGRHYGHTVHFISQRGAQIAKTVRDQCVRLFLFVSSLDDCKVHAREYNKPELLQANTLNQGEYFATGRFQPVVKYSLFGTKTASED